MNEFKKNDYYQNSVVGLTLSAFLGTVALFFAGILITQINSLNDTIRLPIVYLICSTVALVYSAIIYANTAGHVKKGSEKQAIKSDYFANIISEFFGVNVFLISMPLVINVITDDMLIRLAVASVVLLSLVVYTVSSLSILSRVYKKASLLVGSILIGGCGAALIYVQTNLANNFTTVGLIFLFIYIIWVVTLFPRDIDSLKH